MLNYIDEHVCKRCLSLIPERYDIPEKFPFNVERMLLNSILANNPKSAITQDQLGWRAGLVLAEARARRAPIAREHREREAALARQLRWREDVRRRMDALRQSQMQQWQFNKDKIMARCRRQLRAIVRSVKAA